MLSTIVWIIVGIIVASFLIFLFKIFLVVMGVKKVLSIVKEEVEHLPQDIGSVRKTVENENSSFGAKATGTAKQIAKTGWRLFRKI